MQLSAPLARGALRFGAGHGWSNASRRLGDSLQKIECLVRYAFEIAVILDILSRAGTLNSLRNPILFLRLPQFKNLVQWLRSAARAATAAWL